MRSRRRNIVVWSSSAVPASRSGDQQVTRFARGRIRSRRLRTGALLAVIGVMRLARMIRVPLGARSPADRRAAHGHLGVLLPDAAALLAGAPVLFSALPKGSDGKRRRGTGPRIGSIPRALRERAGPGHPRSASPSRVHPPARTARVVRMSLPVRIMGSEGGTATVDDGKANGMTDHNGVLMMQRALLAGTLGLAIAQKAAAILEGEPNQAAPSGTPRRRRKPGSSAGRPASREPQGSDGAVLRAILDAAGGVPRAFR